MSAFSLMSVGSRAVFAAYNQLQTASNNIANANTPGYSRQSAQLATAGSDFTGSGYQGRGVTVTTVARASNMFMTQQVVGTAATAAADSARSDLLSQLEKVFASGAAGLGQSVTQIFNSYADLAAGPGDLAARQAVLGRLEDFASLSRASSDQIEALKGHLEHDVAGAVDQVNALAASLANLNLNIRRATNAGQTPNELFDQRDQLVKRIAEKIEVQTYVGADSTASVFVGIGQTLVLGGDTHRLAAQPNAQDPDQIGVAIEVAGLNSALTLDQVGDGMIGGLMRFQAHDLSDARNRVGQLVAAVAGAINQQQSMGLDLAARAGAPIYSLAGPQVVPAAGNARDGGGQFIAQVSLTVADPSQLKASDYDLVADPGNAGQYRATRLADGARLGPLADGQAFDGLVLHIGATAPAAGESFRLKAVAGAAANLQLVLADPRGLAAANPVTALAAAANTGTVAVRSLNVVAPPGTAYGPLTLTFADDLGAYALGDGGGVVQSGTVVAGQPLLYNGLALTLSGRPQAGDTVQIVPTTRPGANNGNALRLDGLANVALVDGQTAGDAYASAMSAIGVRVQGARVAADTSGNVARRAQTELTGEVGVNLDEEAARLIQFQQAYQASAKILMTAQTLLDTILGLSR